MLFKTLLWGRGGNFHGAFFPQLLASAVWAEVCVQRATGCTGVPMMGADSPGGCSEWLLESGDRLLSAPIHNIALSLYLLLCSGLFYF